MSEEAQEIGPYSIVRCIGEGGKGRVYEAVQSKPVRRTVALKMMRSSCSGPDDELRFFAEQQALALMEHPGIATVFDAGTADDGRQWFAMELVDGLPLIEFADQHKLDLDARLQLFVRVCRAVQHAHQKGVIHRDLKPSNVLVTMADGVPSPKVIDFGVAKAVELRLTEETLLTQFGAIIGTPAYMSPEQAEGTVFSIDARADIYSLGVMLFEMLVGCLPVDPRVTGYPGFIAFLKNPDEEAPTPSSRFRQLPQDRRREIAAARQRGLSELANVLSGDLRWVVLSALAKDPARRYQSAAALGDDLERIARGDVISARPPDLAYVLRRFIARNRIAVAAAAIVILALAGGVIAATIGMLRAEREAQIANTIASFMEDVFAEASPFTRTGEEVTARQLLERAATNIETELAGSPLVQGRLMARIGAAYRDMGLFAEATPLLERSLVLLQEANAEPLLIKDVEAELGYLLIFNSEFARAGQMLQSAFEYFREESGYEDPRAAEALGNLVFNALRSSQGVPEAYALLQEELGPATAAMGEENPSVGQLRYMECWALRATGRPREALATCRNSLALLHRIHDIDSPHIAHNTLALGHTHRALGQFAEALGYYDEVLAINGRLYGADHPETAYTLIAMASARRMLGERDEALDLARRAAGMMERVHGKGSTEYAAVLTGLAAVLAEHHLFDEAEQTLADVISVDASAFGVDSERVAYRRLMLADLLLQQGRLENAEREFAQAAAVLQQGDNLADGAVRTAGRLAYRRGNLASAERYARRAFEISAASPENRPVQLAQARLQLSRVLLARNRLDEACQQAGGARDTFADLLGMTNSLTAMAQSIHGVCRYRAGEQGAGRDELESGLATLRATLLNGDPDLAEVERYAATLGDAGITANPPEKDKSMRETGKR